MSEKMKGIYSLPYRWLSNIIEIQEKKAYNFYVILVFAIFVALMRFIMEFLLAYRVPFLINLSVLNFVTFYLQVIFGYTLILKLILPKTDWEKSIHWVLIGVFLGILPPVIDSFIYGMGNFSYNYIIHVFSEWRPWIYLGPRNMPLGETIILFSTIIFSSLVVIIKTKSFFRAAVTFFLSYFFVFLFIGFLPTLAYKISLYFILTPALNEGLGAGNELLFKGFSYPFMLCFIQIFFTVAIYFFLKPGIFKNLYKRINHAIPMGLTCLLGYSVFGRIDIYSILIMLCVIYLALVTIIQNDYFDRDEDQVDGRELYLTHQDVLFFNSSALLLIILFSFFNLLSAYALLLYFVVSVIYNYDFYRGKSFFPSNYKIEGIWGLASFLAGSFMYFSVSKSYGGDLFGVSNPDSLKPYFSPLTSSIRETFSYDVIILVFLVFGGWSIISVIKDYKDIESDYVVGNQTLYVLLRKRGKDIFRFHRVYTTLLAVLLLVPFLWLLKIEANVLFYLLMFVCSLGFHFSINLSPSNKAVELALICINAYLLNFALACHFSH